MSDNSLQAPSPEHLGELLPQYGIENFIAQGGMGAVYKARQLSLDRDVAIKVLLLEFGGDAEFRESFTTEAKAMARLNHPNLLGVYDYGDVDGMPYIVMEYVEGGSLYQAAWNQVVDPAQAVKIVKAICDGLAHAHGHDIVHRDIKPSNILLTTKAEPKVADFGLAHATDSDQPGLVMGTPGYTAPEVFQDPSKAGKLADIYSVGVILHQLLTGIDPTGSMVPPTQVTGHPQLDLIWRKATHITPALRYASVAEMSNDLAKWASSSKPKVAAAAAGPGVPSRPLAPRRPAKTSAKRSSGGGLIGQLVVFGIIAAAGFYIYQNFLKPKPGVDPGTAGNQKTHTGGTSIPEIPRKSHSPDPVEHHSSPPDPTPPTDVTHVEPEPPPVVDVTPDPKTPQDLPPGDPELLKKAIGLISDARKKRDGAFADNARGLIFQLGGRARSIKSTNKSEAAYIEALKEQIVDIRIPQTDGVTGMFEVVSREFEKARTKETAIEASYLSELTKIRDAYVGRLDKAANETSDADLKQRLQAQALPAKELETWITQLSPEPAYVAKKSTGFSAAGGAGAAGGFAGHWNNTTPDNVSQWIAHSGGKLEVVGQKWELTWAILDDGTLEIRWPDKNPYVYQRNGDGWTGKTSHGAPTTLSRGDW